MYKDILLNSDFTCIRNLKRYIKFLESRPKRTKGSGLHLHHILPRCEWPEYADLILFPWNGIYLTYREHYIAHLMLFLSYKNSHGLAIALNMMNNFCNNHLRYGRTYEEVMRLFRERIAITNSGPKNLSEEQRNNISKRFKGKVVVYDVRDPDKKTFQINREDMEDCHRFHRVGYVHREETRILISENSTKDRKAYNNGHRMIFLKEDELPPDGWTKGGLDSPHVSDNLSDTEWYHCPIKKKNYRIKIGEHIPEGLIRGRFSFNNVGFAIANSKIKVIDLKERKFVLTDEYLPWHAIQSGLSVEKTKIFVFDKIIFSSYIKMATYAETKGMFFERHKTKVDMSYTRKKDKREFVRQNLGKTYEELGLEIFPLSEFDYDKYKDCKVDQRRN